jgi:protein-tyrosine-phosphatase
MLADHADATLITVPISRIVREFGNLLLFRESNDTLKYYDPSPGLAEIRLELTDRLQQRYRKMSIVRQLLERRATLALMEARKVLFVCYGNICRSPFADALMRKVGANSREYRSAGFHPVDSRPSPPLAIETAEELGVSLETHRSTTITEEMVRWADIVIIFDRSHEKAFNSQFPQFLQKVHYLGALDRSRPLEIHDPYGQDPALFKSCFAHICSVIETAVVRTKIEL